MAKYDQLHEAVLEIHSMHASVGTDFTTIVEQVPSSSDQDAFATRNATYAILIRNPEPFNDPRLPQNVLSRTVAAEGFVSVVTRDASRALLVRPDGRRIRDGDYELTFEQWSFGSSGLELTGTEKVTITLRANR